MGPDIFVGVVETVADRSVVVDETPVTVSAVQYFVGLAAQFAALVLFLVLTIVSFFCELL